MEQKATKIEEKEKNAREIVGQLPAQVQEAVNAMQRTNLVRRVNRRQKTYVQYQRVGSVE